MNPDYIAAAIVALLVAAGLVYWYKQKGGKAEVQSDLARISADFESITKPAAPKPVAAPAPVASPAPVTTASAVAVAPAQVAKAVAPAVQPAAK